MHHPVTERHVQAIWYDRTLRPRNLVTRRGMTVAMCGERLIGRDHNPPAFYAGNGLHLQGLLQIYRDHCLQHHPDCHDCRLADRSRTPVQAG